MVKPLYFCKNWGIYFCIENPSGLKKRFIILSFGAIKQEKYKTKRGSIKSKVQKFKSEFYLALN